MHIALSTPSLGLSVSPALTSDLLSGAQIYVQDDTNDAPYTLPGKRTVSFSLFYTTTVRFHAEHKYSPSPAIAPANVDYKRPSGY